jgi:hypothetical protein
MFVRAGLLGDFDLPHERVPGQPRTGPATRPQTYCSSAFFHRMGELLIQEILTCSPTNACEANPSRVQKSAKPHPFQGQGDPEADPQC